ncbi:MAG: response regulator transcription factor [Candidatus Methylomirabilia bacterium]
MTEERKKKVLIVDDEVFIVETVKFALEHAGYECVAAYDGIEAVRLTREAGPDLILLDIMLPKLNGFKVCRLLKFDERFKHIPVIMMTARTQEKDRTLGKETGADEYMTKPFEIDEMLRLVKKHLAPAGNPQQA